MKNTLTTEEKIEAFCRELAQALRQLTGRDAPITDQEFKTLASQVKATPKRPAKKGATQ